MDTARLIYHQQEWTIPAGIPVREAIAQVGLDPSNVLALRNKRLINDKTIVEPSDEIQLVNVISGG